MMWEGIDQRKFPRVNHKCRITVSRAGEDEMIEADTENIGIGGICVVTEKKFELFETVSIKLQLGGDEKPVECDGTICWVVGRHPSAPYEEMAYDVGIEFQDIADEDRGRIGRLVENILAGRP